MSILVKICGLKDEDSIFAAVEEGADFLGFVFYPKSPRFITPSEVAELTDGLPDDVYKVGLFVNPTIEELDSVLSEVRLDFIQLHGNETPEFLDSLRQEFALPIIKAVGISCAADIDAALQYKDSADWLLFDAKPPKEADRPGGNALSFDWNILAGREFPLPIMLAGGLDAGNVALAIGIVDPQAVDVSSGVEDSPGVKNPDKIRLFIENAKLAK